MIIIQDISNSLTTRGLVYLLRTEDGKQTFSAIQSGKKHTWRGFDYVTCYRDKGYDNITNLHLEFVME